MITTSRINSTVQLSVEFAGQAPTNAGRISFSPSGSTTVEVDSANVYSKRILLADLALVSTTYSFKLNLSGAYMAINAGSLAENLVGDDVAFFSTLGLVYIRTNAYATIGGVLPIPTSIDADGIIFVKSALPNGVVSGLSGPVLTLEWTLDSITAAGTTNFFCDLIFSAST